ncbi:hypothetical protein CYMTET_17779 [Cymbomonas tetramitiformis]|uniref:Uncharacterized protein n=1 Tax=Cymbomonas tetramitiformis TaxID=36881 RepID=A0AAE0G9Q8_9CHLO|nr:hypothetical protein CYMTET_17779 [Cymbomonas tetramitiformis]
MRHPALTLLLSKSIPASSIKADPLYTEQVNQLFYDFLCRVTTGTANTIVRGFDPTSDGYSAWRALVKLRCNTGVVYFIAQIDKLISQAGQLAILSPPLQSFLDGKETLRLIREYTAVTNVMPSGRPVCLETVEMIYTAMAIVKLHPDYMLLKSKFMTDSLPTSDVLADHVTSHYDTILAPRAAATHTANAAESEAAGAIVDDRRKQEEMKRQRLAVKVPCSVCHRPGHPAKECFMTNDEKREQFLKKASSSAKAAILKKVADYKKHGKLPVPGEHLSAAAGQSDLCLGLEDTGEVLFALSEAAPFGLCPGLEDIGESLYALRVVEPSHRHPELAESPYSHYPLDSLPSPTPYQLCFGKGFNRAEPIGTPFSELTTFNYYSVLDGVSEPALTMSAAVCTGAVDCGHTSCESSARASSAWRPPRRLKKHHCYVPGKHTSQSSQPYQGQACV